MPHFKGFARINLLLLFCSHIQSLVEIESVIIATASYFEHTAFLTYLFSLQGIVLLDGLMLLEPMIAIFLPEMDLD